MKRRVSSGCALLDADPVHTRDMDCGTVLLYGAHELTFRYASRVPVKVHQCTAQHSTVSRCSTRRWVYTYFERRSGGDAHPDSNITLGGTVRTREESPGLDVQKARYGTLGYNKICSTVHIG